MIQFHKPDNLCRICAYSKDNYKGRYAEGCFCTQYGYIVSRRKESCNGYVYRGSDNITEGGNAFDGNVTGTYGTGF